MVDKPQPLGATPPDDAGAPGRATIEWLAVAATLLWLAGAGAMLWTAPEGAGPLGRTLMAVATILPILLIWLAVLTARSARALRAEAARLQALVDTMRAASLAQAQGGVREGPNLERRLQELMAAQRRTEAALAQLTGAAPERTPALSGPAEPAPATPEPQPALALGSGDTPAHQPVSMEDFLRALNFPDSPEDKPGFRALRLALADARAARLIRAAQDVLTLLSEDGIYMDDLVPDPPRPDLWRRFARGERGPAVAAMGGVRDRASLALASGRMREDAVFRDAAHHFLRHFDRMLETFETSANDAQIARLAETRSARAFLLLGRVTGSFG